MVDEDMYGMKRKSRFFKKKNDNKMLKESNEIFEEGELVIRNQILKY